jgi:D-glycero-D-manno-heptose 1,7-bisphosphate phosphatase
MGGINLKLARAVFLDRDGVINEAKIIGGKPYPPRTLCETKIPVEVYPMLQRLKEAKFLLIVVTNQPDIARKLTKKVEIEKINEYLVSELPLDDIFVCPHDDIDGCGCRKPKTGLIDEATIKYSIDLKNSFLIGDRWRDVDAGNAAGCTTFFINRNYDEKQPLNADFYVESLKSAVSIILGDRDEFS